MPSLILIGAVVAVLFLLILAIALRSRSKSSANLSQTTGFLTADGVKWAGDLKP